MSPGDLHIVASGHRHPETVLGTDDLEWTLPNLEPGWVSERLGMRSRHVAAPHERMADHAIGALNDALGRADWDAEDLDLIVCGASFLEDLMPSRASVISEAVNPSALAFDLNAACSSALYALVVADALLQATPSVDRAAVCVVERPTMNADYRDSHSSVFFGDSAACILVERRAQDQSFAVDAMALLNDGVGSEAVRLPRYGQFRHDNREAFRHVMEMGEAVATTALDDVGIDIDGIDYFVGHQANQSVLSSLGERLGLPWERQWHNFSWAGNQGAAGVLTAFSDGWLSNEKTLQPGERVMLNTVGSGYSAGAVVLRWVG